MQTNGTHSEVTQEAFQLLRQQELEKSYKEASDEVDQAFDVTISDGINHEIC